MAFKPGVSGNPSGRPKLDKQKMFLSLRFEENGFDWVEHYKKALIDKDRVLLDHYGAVMNYLCAQIHVREFEIKPDSPETSVTNADAMLAANKAERMKALDALKPTA